ncbi:ABC transporter substrate-binding protein [Salinibacterium sp. GXW1014]|uniref:ABC transporter substrate-binding protein n=1 Tax=Salinibacterium sp. GXW1014 TaxID=3377838 RepID=UPI00383A8432
MRSSRNHTRRKLITLVSLTAVASLALSGCTAAADGNEAADGPTKISVVLASIAFENAYQAKEQGFFEDEGLDVTLVPGGDPAANLAQLVSGEVDFAMVGGSTAVTAVTNGLPVKVVLNNESIDPEAGTSGLVSAPGSPITSMEDMKGKSVAVLGLATGAELQLYEAAEDAGVAFDAMQLVVTPLPGMLEAVGAGHVDTALIFPPFYDIAKAQGFTVIGEPTREYGGGMPNTVWVATENTVETRSDVVDRFRSAMSKAADFYNENYEDARRITGEQTEIPAELLENRVYVERDPAVYVERYQYLIDTMVRFGQVENSLSVEDVLAEGTPTR